MELLKELLVVTGRILTIIPLMLFMTLYMGKRSIGELPIFDFLVTIAFGSVVGADIADPSVSHIHTAIAIVLFGLFQRSVSIVLIKHRKLGHLITFSPTIIILDGKLISKNLKKQRYSINNILQMLREKDVFNIKDVHLGIIEANGRLSVLKKPNKSMVTIEDLNLTQNVPSISYPVIIEGKIYNDILNKFNLNENWLHQQLLSLNITNINEVFFATINEKMELHISLKNFMNDQSDPLPIYH
jgi:uncharacterized membrane protein YcaP (DUF421 family)